jgi:hypothetical protein
MSSKFGIPVSWAQDANFRTPLRVNTIILPAAANMECAMYVMPITSYRGKKDDGKAISFAYSRYCWASLHARVDALQTVWTLDSFFEGGIRTYSTGYSTAPTAVATCPVRPWFYWLWFAGGH